MTEPYSDALRSAFDNAAPAYDALRRKLIPHFDAFYGTALDLLAETVGEENSVASTLAWAPVFCRR